MFDTKDEKSVAGGGQGPPLQVHHKSAVVEYHSIGGAEMGQKEADLITLSSGIHPVPPGMTCAAHRGWS